MLQVDVNVSELREFAKRLPELKGGKVCGEWGKVTVIRFSRVDLLLDFLKKVAKQLSHDATLSECVHRTLARCYGK
jgi:hypothetical protein